MTKFTISTETKLNNFPKIKAIFAVKFYFICDQISVFDKVWRQKKEQNRCFCRVFAELVKTKVSKKIKDEIEVLCRQIYYNREYNQKKNKSYAKNIFYPITLEPLSKKYQ